MALTKVNRGGLNTGISDSSDATAITIDSSENVTLSSDIELSSSGPKLTFTDTAGTNDVSTVQCTGGALIFTARDGSSRGEVIFKTDTGSAVEETMRINNSTQILMGMSSNLVDSPNNPLVQVQGAIGIHQSNASNSQTCMVFQNDNGRVGFIDTNANSVTYHTSSDYRLKENVSYTWDATTSLKQLKPCKFNFITEPTNTIEGFLAHEVSSIVPQAVSGTKDAVDDNGNIINQAIDHSKLVPLLVKTIQELEARITALEGE